MKKLDDTIGEEPRVFGIVPNYPSAAWAKWYRQKTGCSLSEAVWAGRRRMAELRASAGKS